MDFHLAEKGPNLRKDSPESHLLWRSRTITGALNNGCGSFVGWTCARDENGNPYLAPFDCAGQEENHSRTREIPPVFSIMPSNILPGSNGGTMLLKDAFRPCVPENLACSVCRNPWSR